jgi:hypothetical protein
MERKGKLQEIVGDISAGLLKIQESGTPLIGPQVWYANILRLLIKQPQKQDQLPPSGATLI